MKKNIGKRGGKGRGGEGKKGETGGKHDKKQKRKQKRKQKGNKKEGKSDGGNDTFCLMQKHTFAGSKIWVGKKNDVFYYSEKKHIHFCVVALAATAARNIARPSEWKGLPIFAIQNPTHEKKKVMSGKNRGQYSSPTDPVRDHEPRNTE